MAEITEIIPVFESDEQPLLTNPSTFSIYTDNYHIKLNQVIPSINTWSTQVNALRTELNNNASTAVATATTKAGEASASATLASNAQAAAESARDEAEAIYDNFDDRYLGAKATPPTLDNDGNPLASGSLYYNTSSNTMFVYDSILTTWIDITYVPTLLSGLSDVLFSGLADGDVLRYDSATTKWVNEPISVSATLVDLTDTTIITPSDKQILEYNNATSKWENVENPSYTKTESDDKFIDNTSNETIDGTKTFSSSPIVPKPTFTSTSNNKAIDQSYFFDDTNFDGIEYFDDGLLGVPDTTFSSTGARIYPDGTIRGKSSYGEYVKYPDGRLECAYKHPERIDTTTAIGAIYKSSPLQVYFPVMFISNPYVVSGGVISNQLFYCSTQSITTSGLLIYMISPTSQTNTGYPLIIATGRWK